MDFVGCPNCKVQVADVGGWHTQWGKVIRRFVQCHSCRWVICVKKEIIK